MNIEYTIRINVGNHGGMTISIDVPIEELEYSGLASILVKRSYLKCWCNDGEFDVLSRVIK